VFIHWTPASVPGYAPTHTGVSELFASGRPDALSELPYTEWYQNSLRFPDSSVSRHHRTHHPGRSYEDFAAAYDDALAGWRPQEWAERFARSGARYVVLVAKHHDGYCLWPSTVRNPRRSGWHTTRDVVGDLADAVRAAGLRFGLYYSGGLDWTFDDRPLGSVADVVAAMPRGDYPAYAEAQVRELIERYRPSVLWNDITWPTDRDAMFALFEHYYRIVPDGILNDRWMPWSPAMGLARFSPVRRAIDAGSVRSARREGGLVPPRPPHFDVRTPEYTVFDEVQREPWECVRGMDHSFGYNRTSSQEDFIGHDELRDSLAGIVAAGGNLLLNVGPRGEDATIPDEQLERLERLGGWTSGPGSSIFGSRPWVRARAVTPEGSTCRFWCADTSLWVAVDRVPHGGALTVAGVGATPASTAQDHAGRALGLRGVDGGVRLELDDLLAGEPAVIRLDHVEALSPAR
jgi:alpha-L-fucosidase